jgi:beta-phosphoglucomutase-like phosphatase (HAD superfamily)
MNAAPGGNAREDAASAGAAKALPDLASAFKRADFDGYIFDCDGTLADSMPLHYRAWTESLSDKLGRPSVEFTEDLFYHFGGMPARHIVERLNRDFGYNLPVEATAHEKEEHFISLMHHGLKPVPEVVAVLRTLVLPAKVIVASGGLTNIVEDTLRHVGIAFGPGEIVQRVIGSDQVKLGKPSPDLFLRAAEVLGVPPARCLVFEDAAPGFEAATAAGMKYIDVRPYRASIHRAAQY